MASSDVFGGELLNVISVCSGIGGGDLGFKRAGFRTILYIENEPFCHAQLLGSMEKGRLDIAPIFTDLTRFDARGWREVVDCIFAGIPCQPHSRAGKRLGKEDSRNLWPDLQRVITQCCPRVVVIENVEGLYSGEDAYGPEISAELYAMGYVVVVGYCSAAQVGAPHERMRTFTIGFKFSDTKSKRRSESGQDKRRCEEWTACSSDISRIERLSKETLANTHNIGYRGRGKVQFQEKNATETQGRSDFERDFSHSHCFGLQNQKTWEGKSLVDGGGGEVSNTNSQRCNTRSNNGEERSIHSTQKRSSAQDQSEWNKRQSGISETRPIISNTNSKLLKKPRISKSNEKEHPFIGSNGWWKTEPNVGRVVNGISKGVDRHIWECQIKALGNAVVPQVAQEIGEFVKEIAGGIQ